MGFIETEKCPICGRELTVFDKTMAKFDNRYLCRKCYDNVKKLGISLSTLNSYDEKYKKNYINYVKNACKQEEVRKASFHATKQVGNIFRYDERKK